VFNPNLALVPTVTYPPPLQIEGFFSQDHIGGFSMKQEYANTTQEAYKTIIMKLKLSYYTLVSCIRITRGEAPKD
jgi:hypothetical protein